MVGVLFLFTRAQLGGTETAISRMAAHLDPVKFRVVLAALESHGPLYDFLAQHKLQAHVFSDSNFGYQYLLHNASQVRNLVTTAKIDVIYAFGLTAELVALTARRTSRFPAIVSGQRGGYANRSLRGLLRGYVANACDLIVFNSEAALQGAIKYNYFSSEKSRVVYNGIQPVAVSDTDTQLDEQTNTILDAHGLGNCREQLVVTIANIHAHKDYSTLLEAARLVVDRIPSARFIAIGRDEMANAVQHRAATLGLCNAFVFLGPLPNPVALTILERAVVYVLSSLSEGMPNSILEAMMLGKPVVASDVGGVSELVKDGISGLLFPSGDAYKCAAQIESLLSDRLLSQQMGEVGRQRIQALFTIERSVEATQRVLDEISIRTR